MQIKRHFAATTYVVYNNKVLLHKHKKLGLWIPIGGHIDENELPEETAMREIKEEFGLEVKLIWHDTIKQLSEDEQSQPRVKIINRPIHILLEDLKDHQHIDLIYYAIAISDKVTLEEGISEYKWASEDDLEEMNLQQNVLLFSKEALHLSR